MGIPMLKIRRSYDHLIFNKGIPIPARRHLHIEMASWIISLEHTVHVIIEIHVITESQSVVSKSKFCVDGYRNIDHKIRDYMHIFT